MENLKFKVDLRGIIDLLSEHIYTTPNVFLRELLQNSVDAIEAKKVYDAKAEGKITVRLLNQNPAKLIVEDNGIGLTEDEIHNFLAIIGESSKRHSHVKENFIGKFGVGLLSAFVVSNEVIVQTKSEADENAYQWTAKADGTYKINILSESRPTGTAVILEAKPEMRYYFLKNTLLELLKHYGEALPYPIHFYTTNEKNGEQQHTIVNPQTPIWLQEGATQEQLLEYGKTEFNQDFLTAFPIKIDELGLQGSAFISSQKLHLNSKTESKVFVKRMLLSEKIEDLLPKWGFFIKVIVNINELTPTASREDFVHDTTFKICKDLLNDSLKNYFKELSQNNPNEFVKILEPHYQSIKMLANEDETLLDLFINYLIFETNKGRKNFEWIKKNIKAITYTTSLEDFKQIRRLANSKDIFVINAAYSFEENLMKSIIKKYPKLDIKTISPSDVLNDFEELSEEEITEHQVFLNKATEIMQPYFCEVALKKFFPADLPVLFVSDEESMANYQTQKLAKDSKNPFASILDMSEKKAKPTLCLNLNNTMVATLLQAHDKELFAPLLKTLYIQSLFLGQFPINKHEMEVLNLSLLTITKNTLK
ncbi:HSP90 family protein [Bernardetia sp. Wsw4-3y2]|uniref:HSP90 family protein n=1 Tax=Bernardetia sp. Wsw4-3y2 TaxID=3127471 RepID=UPI0030CF2D5B